MPDVLSPDLPTDAQVRDLLTVTLTEAVDAVALHLQHSGPEVDVLIEATRRAVSGGKRLRALLCVAGWEVAGTADTLEPTIVKAAAALELFQAAALVHDDLMDASDTRRGDHSAHRWFETQHPAGLATDRVRVTEFGASSAVLLGDLLLTLSSTTLHAAIEHLPNKASAAGNLLYSQMSAEVAWGQYLDLYAAHAPWDDAQVLDRAFRVIQAKTARYSVELPLVLGAQLAQATPATLTWLAAIGQHVGTAFQLRDDVLGVFGDPAVTGKPAGDDLREGKRTVLVAFAAQDASASDRTYLVDNLGRRDLTAEQIDRMSGILRTTGALARVEQLIADESAQAFALLEAPPTAMAHTTRLRGLMTAAIQRSA